VNPRASLDDMEKWKFLTLRDSNSDPSVVQPVASRYTDYVIPVRREKENQEGVGMKEQK
jgi:hypothetical protein